MLWYQLISFCGGSWLCIVNVSHPRIWSTVSRSDNPVSLCTLHSSRDSGNRGYVFRTSSLVPILNPIVEVST